MLRSCGRRRSALLARGIGRGLPRPARDAEPGPATVAFAVRTRAAACGRDLDRPVASAASSRGTAAQSPPRARPSVRSRRCGRAERRPADARWCGGRTAREPRRIVAAARGGRIDATARHARHAELAGSRAGLLGVLADHRRATDRASVLRRSTRCGPRSPPRLRDRAAPDRRPRAALGIADAAPPRLRRCTFKRRLRATPRHGSSNATRSRCCQRGHEQGVGRQAATRPGGSGTRPRRHRNRRRRVGTAPPRTGCACRPSVSPAAAPRAPYECGLARVQCLLARKRAAARRPPSARSPRSPCSAT